MSPDMPTCMQERFLRTCIWIDISDPFLGLGVASISSNQEPILAVSAQKKLALLDGPNTVMSAKLAADVDTKGGIVRDFVIGNNMGRLILNWHLLQLRRQARIKLSHKALNFTQRQDLKLTVGLDIDWPADAKTPKQVRISSMHEPVSKHF
jgi:hypothetical protein